MYADTEYEAPNTTETPYGLVTLVYKLTLSIGQPGHAVFDLILKINK